MIGPVVSLLALHSLLASVQYIQQLFFRWKARRPDFSTLPRIPWVIILSYLDVEDRYAISQTCQELQHIYLTESHLWRTIVVLLENGDQMKKELTPAEKAFLTSNVYNVETIQFVLQPSFQVSGETLAAITNASGKWRLKKLEIYGPERYLHHRFTLRIHLDMELFLTRFLPSRATETLEVLNLHEWKWCDEMMPALLMILSCVGFTHSLRQLKLGLMGLTDVRYNWMHDISRGAFIRAVRRFVNLQVLDIPSVYVSDNFLVALSQTRQRPLEKLVIEGNHFYDAIQPSSWLQLMASSPGLEVHFRVSIGYRFDCSNLTDIFPQSVPVTKIYLNKSHQNIDQYGIKHYKALTYLAQLFCKHLKALSYSEGCCQKSIIMGPDKELRDIVFQCSNLTQLSFDGRVHSDTILQLAALPRNWTVFEFFFGSIIFTFNMTEERLCREVSRYLQRPWQLSKSSWKNVEKSWLVRNEKGTLSVRMLEPVVRI